MLPRIGGMRLWHRCFPLQLLPGAICLQRVRVFGPRDGLLRIEYAPAWEVGYGAKHSTGAEVSVYRFS